MVIASNSNVVIASIFCCVLACSLHAKPIVGNRVFLDFSYWAAFPGLYDERAITRSAHKGFESESTPKHFLFETH